MGFRAGRLTALGAKRGYRDLCRDNDRDPLKREATEAFIRVGRGFGAEGVRVFRV